MVKVSVGFLMRTFLESGPVGVIAMVLGEERVSRGVVLAGPAAVVVAVVMVVVMGAAIKRLEFYRRIA